MDPRKLFAETLGTALLVFFGVGAATISFGFKLAGLSPSAGSSPPRSRSVWCSSPSPTPSVRSAARM